MRGACVMGAIGYSSDISLVAVYIAVLFMPGLVGGVLREFSVTLAFAIAVSTAVSLSLTPMICAHFVRKPPSPDATWLDRVVERTLGLLVRAYAQSLSVLLAHPTLTLFLMPRIISPTATL